MKVSHLAHEEKISNSRLLNRILHTRKKSHSIIWYTQWERKRGPEIVGIQQQNRSTSRNFLPARSIVASMHKTPAMNKKQKQQAIRHSHSDNQEYESFLVKWYNHYRYLRSKKWDIEISIHSYIICLLGTRYVICIFEIEEIASNSLSWSVMHMWD